MVDLILLVILVISVLIGLYRGFWRELVSLATWGGALFVTVWYSRQFATLLPSDTIESVPARLALSAVVLFVGCLLIGALINFIYGRIAAARPMTWVNRFGGIFFGLFRGAVINALLVLGGHLFPGMQQELWWRESRLLPNFDKMAESIHAELPRELADHFDFSTAKSQ